MHFKVNQPVKRLVSLQIKFNYGYLMFSGIITAIVTPFSNGRIDEDRLVNLISHQLDGGVQGILPCGTTGESPTLTFDEYKRVIKITVETVGKRVPVVSGAGSYSTAKAIELIQVSKSLGVDATLQVVPYYNKPTQEGLFQHFKALAQEGMPVMLYNIPGRTGINMLPETVARLAEFNEIIAIKEASGSVTQMAEVRELCGDKLTLLTGDDAQTLPSICMGCAGTVSVMSNLLPKEMVGLYQDWNSGKTTKAIQDNKRLFPVMQAMFVEPNPVPVKTAMVMKKIIKSSEVRLPLCAMSKANEEMMVNELTKAKFL